MAELNLNNLLYLKDETFEHSCSLSVFGGRPSWTIFKMKESGPPVAKALMSETSLFLFQECCEKILAVKEEKVLSFEIWFFDRDSKESKYDCTVSIGRDAKLQCYIEITTSKHKTPLRFLTVTDTRIRMGGQELPGEKASELGLRSIINYIGNIMGGALIMSRTKQPPNGNAGGQTTPAVGAPVSGDVPF